MVGAYRRRSSVVRICCPITTLSQHPGIPVVVWYIHALSGARYVLMENAQSNVAMGCIAGASNISFEADGFVAAQLQREAVKHELASQAME